MDIGALLTLDDGADESRSPRAGTTFNWKRKYPGCCGG
jgi:hypothetical protein